MRARESGTYRFVFGPVASRRLGRSLGVNNLPCKTCSYSCVYCQLGRTPNPSIERGEFYNWREVVGEVLRAVKELEGEVDYVTFVSCGEPALDKNIGLEIRAIKEGVVKPVAVFTNTSLLYLEEVRVDLLGADLVSVKVDAAREETWRRVNRPHPELDLDRVLEGVAEFAGAFGGSLVSETMLVDGLNTSGEDLDAVAGFLRDLDPVRAYIAIPVRPPAEPYVRPPPPRKLVEAYELFRRALGDGRVQLLNLPEPPEFRVFGDPEAWLLGLVSVHPLRLDYAVRALRSRVEDPEGLVARLRERGELEVVEYGGREYVVRSYGTSGAMLSGVDHKRCRG